MGLSITEVKYFGRLLYSYMLKFTQKLVDDPSTKDNTETNLTIDLYTSHFDLNDHYVYLNTTDLLELGNVLWLFKDRIMLLDRPEDDRLYQLLLKIQPPKPALEEDAAGKDKKHDNMKYVAVRVGGSGGVSKSQETGG